MMSENILVVVDMQSQFIRRSNYKFKQHYNQVIDTVAKEIKSAKKNNELILFVEMTESNVLPFGFTSSSNAILPELLEPIKDYKKKAFIYKHHLSGGPNIKKYLEYYYIKPKRFNVCGVYINACVYETLKDLLKYYPKNIFKINRAATTDNVSSHNEFALQELKNLNPRNVKLYGETF